MRPVTSPAVTYDPSSLYLGLAIAALTVFGMWSVFRKTGRPGWPAVVPFYNVWVLARVAGRPGWWGILLVVPVLGAVLGIIVARDVGCRFGKGPAFSFFLLWLLFFIGYPILGWSDARVVRPSQ
ncbi:hypothetical protein DVJ78_16665 [Humibacter sp. BT305]|nr:hypothetical protein DVJ78_16665 [Humibacter sp. BT305]